MHKKLSAGVLAVAGLVCASSMSGAATLDDVMARLDSLQRDNAAMRKEIAALRQKEQRSAPAQAADTRNAPSHQLPPEASSAMAAAYPVKGRYAEPPRAFSWDGFYVGVHGGYGWGSNDWNLGSLVETPLITASPLSPQTNGVLGGIQAGANLQLDHWVFGIEADLAFMHADKTNSGAVLGPAPIPGFLLTARSQIDWLATFTGRWGYAFDRSLFYVKGGIAAAGYTENLSFTQSAPAPALFLNMGTKESTRVGWTVGGGWEYAFAPNWSAKIEYNYLDFGTSSETFTSPVPGAATTFSFKPEIDRSVQIVKAGVNYRF